MVKILFRAAHKTCLCKGYSSTPFIILLHQSHMLQSPYIIIVLFCAFFYLGCMDVSDFKDAPSQPDEARQASEAQTEEVEEKPMESMARLIQGLQENLEKRVSCAVRCRKLWK